MSKTPITVAYGDGIGPEIMKATLRILEAAGANIEPEIVEIGAAVYHQGHSAGIQTDTWESLRRTKIFLKAPITTPIGGGFKSLNVTVRKTLGLYANVRPCRAYYPYVRTRHPDLDLVIIRENEEDLYGGIEHRQTDEVVQSLKLISRPGSERIVRFAFEYAKRRGRKKVACMVKDNIMKMSDGLFRQVFNEIGAEYPEIEKENYIIDIGMALVADRPIDFDVIVLPNLYGDILSDIAAQISGSVGMGGSANIGEEIAMFEAVHGSAPTIAGRDVANPSGLLLGAIQMLAHIGDVETAVTIHNAWLRTIEDGHHTVDVYTDYSNRLVGTQEFADSVIQRLGQKPNKLRQEKYLPDDGQHMQYMRPEPAKKELVGIDVFFDWRGTTDELVEKLRAMPKNSLGLHIITNRGVKVWPEGFPETFCSDHWRCRYHPTATETTTHKDILSLLDDFADAGLDFIKTEHLYTFDGKRGFSLAQGQ